MSVLATFLTGVCTCNSRLGESFSLILVTVVLCHYNITPRNYTGIEETKASQNFSSVFAMAKNLNSCQFSFFKIEWLCMSSALGLKQRHIRSNQTIKKKKENRKQ